MLLAALKTQLNVSGVRVTTSGGDTLKVLVDEAPDLNDPVDNMQTKTPVYVRLQAAYGGVADPRTVTRFTEDDGHWFDVIRFEDRHHSISHSWICESQRRSSW